MATFHNKIIIAATLTTIFLCTVPRAEAEDLLTYDQKVGLTIGVGVGVALLGSAGIAYYAKQYSDHYEKLKGYSGYELTIEQMTLAEELREQIKWDLALLGISIALAGGGAITGGFGVGQKFYYN